MIKNENPTIENISKVVDSRTDGLVKPVVVEETGAVPTSVQVEDPVATHVENYASLRKAIRTAAVWLVGWTVFSAIDMNIPWAIALAVVSAMSFYFYDVASLFLVYAGVMLWAAIWNIFLSGDFMWVVMGIVQVAFSIFTIREYRKYKNAKAGYVSVEGQYALPASPKRESRLPWLALILGAVILVGVVGFVPAGILMSDNTSPALEELVGMIMLVILELGALGMPIGIAAIISGYRPRAAAAVGIGLGVISGVLSIASVLVGSSL